MLWAPRGAGVEDLQNVMDPPTAEEPLGSRAEGRCGRDGGTWKDAYESMPLESNGCLEASQDTGWLLRERDSCGTERRGSRGGGTGRRLEEKQQDACLAALLGRLDVQLDTKGIVSLFISLTQYKQITHGPMGLAKHRVQCIQKHISYEERIHQTIYTAGFTKQLSLNAIAGLQRAADLG